MSAPAANAFSLPVQDNAADARVGVEGEQRRAELVHQRVVQRVELLRPVEGDHAGAALALAVGVGEDAFVAAHRGAPQGRRRQQ
jgi:hypothetical protein